MRWERGIPAERVDRIAEEATANGSAVVVGTRAGIVEWSNEGWPRLTGYALHRAAGKPIVDFLAAAGAKPELVEFVAECVAARRSCELEVPHDLPGGEGVWVRLRVEPVVDAAGEVTRFIAMANEVGRGSPPSARGLFEVDLSQVAGEVAGRRWAERGPRTAFDLSLGRDLPTVLADRNQLDFLLDRLVCRAMEAVHDAWGTLTITTGILGCGVAPLFRGPLPEAPRESLSVFAEIHDTGSAPAAGARREVTEPFLSARHAASALSTAGARSILRRFGGELRIDNDPGVGTSVVLVLPCFLP